MVESSVAQSLEQTGLQMDGEMLQLNDGCVVPRCEGVAEACHPSLLLHFDFEGNLVDALLQQPGRRRGALEGALALDLADDDARIAEGLFDTLETGLPRQIPHSAGVSVCRVESSRVTVREEGAGYTGL